MHKNLLLTTPLLVIHFCPRIVKMMKRKQVWMHETLCWPLPYGLN